MSESCLKAKRQKLIRYVFEHRFYLVVYLIMLIINLICVYGMKAPMIIDEYLTFSNGAFLSGKYDWSGAYSALPGTPYYGYGLAILYIPLFWLPLSIYTVFKCALCINALLISFVPVIVLYILNHIDIDVQNSVKIFLPLSVGGYSAYIYQSKGVWNETLLQLIPWLIMLLLFQLYTETKRCKKWMMSALLAFLTVYMYVLNARGVIAICAVFLTIFLVGIFLKRLIVNIPFFGGVFIITYAVNKVIKAKILNGLLKVQEGASVQNSSVNLGQILSQISLETFLKALKGFWGDFYYVFLVSFGIVAIGIIGALIYFFVGIKSKKSGVDDFGRTYIIGMFSVASLIGTWLMLFLVSYNTFVLKDFTKRDVIMYGRYFDYLIPEVMFFAYLVCLQNRKKLTKICAASGVLNIFILVIGTLATGKLLIAKNNLSFQPLNTGTLFAFAGKNFFRTTEYKDIMILIFFVSVIFLLFWFCFFKKIQVVFFAVVSICYVYAAGWVVSNYCWPTSQNQYESYHEYTTFFNSLNNDDRLSINNVYFLSNKIRDRAINIQYAVPEYKIKQLNYYIQGFSCLKNVEENSLIISSQDLQLERYFNDVYLVKTDSETMYVWVYGDVLKKDLEDSGVLFEMEEYQVDIKKMASKEIKYQLEMTFDYKMNNGAVLLDVRGKNLSKINISQSSFEGFEDIKIIEYTDNSIKIEAKNTGDFRATILSDVDFSEFELQSILVTEIDTDNNTNEYDILDYLMVDSCRIIDSGDLLYGPYEYMMEGEYEVTIYGQNIENAEIDFCYDKGNIIVDAEKKENKEKGKTSLILKLDKSVNDIEYRVHDIQKNEISVEKITIERLGKVNIGADFDDEIEFTTINLNSSNSMAGAEFLNYLYEYGPQYIYFGQDNGLKINNLTLPKGKYEIEVKGKDLRIEAILKDAEGREIENIEYIIVQNDGEYCKIHFSVEQDIERCEMIIYTLATTRRFVATDEGLVKISDITISKIN